VGPIGYSFTLRACDGSSEFEKVDAYEVSIGRVMLSVQNLGNTDYVTYYSDTQGPTDDARFYTGRGRNFTLSWQAAF
jgi:iron complex outermembrane receptor protein